MCCVCSRQSITIMNVHACIWKKVFLIKTLYYGNDVFKMLWMICYFMTSLFDKKNSTMASGRLRYLCTLVLISIIEKCLGNPVMEEFRISTDVSVLESLSLTCYEESSVRNTLEASVVCSGQDGCRAVTKPYRLCECPLEPTLRTWQSSISWLQSHLWNPHESLPSKHHSMPVNVTLDISGSPIESQWGSRKYPG